MKDNERLEKSMTNKEQAENNQEKNREKNLEYLDLLYDGGVYAVGQHYICIKSDFRDWGRTTDRAIINEGLVGVDLYDKNLGLIGQYNTKDDIISYEFPSEGREYEWFIMQLQRKHTINDNYLIVISMDYNDFNNDGIVIHNSQKINMLQFVGYEEYQNENTFDFWQHALGISLVSTDYVEYIDGLRLSNISYRDRQDIIINIETFKVLGIFKGSYNECIGDNSITDKDGNCIYFGWTSKGVQAIEHKFDGSAINIKTFDTVEDLFNNYKPQINVSRSGQMGREDDYGYDYKELGYTDDEKYFKFRGQLQSDNRLRKVGEFIEIDEWDLYVENKALNLLNIDGKKLDIETTSKEQDEVIKAFEQEQTASSQCPMYIRQTDQDKLIIVQNNTIIAGSLEGENIDNTWVTVWHKFNIEQAFRNKTKDNETLMYNWRFLEDSVECDHMPGSLYKANKVYLCVEEYSSSQKQEQCVLMYNMHTGEVITDKNKISQVYKIHNREVDRHSDKRGKDWFCIWDRCCAAWDKRCSWHKKFAKRYELYGDTTKH